MMLDGMSSTDYSAMPLSGTQTTSISSAIGGAEASGSADVDLYRVVLGAGDKITVSTQTPGDLDTHLRLFDEAGVELVSNNNTTDDAGNYTTDSKLVFRALMAGNYYIGVSNGTNTYYSALSTGGSSSSGYPTSGYPTSGYSSGSYYGSYGYSGYGSGSSSTGSTGDYVLNVALDINDAPVTVNDSASSASGAAVHHVVTTNDSDPEGDSFQVVAVTSASHGVATMTTASSSSGSSSYDPNSSYYNYDPSYYNYYSYGGSSSSLVTQVNYTPNAGFEGTEVLTYTVRDTYGKESTGTLTVTVTNNGGTVVNQAPVTSGDAIQVNSGASVVVPVTNNDSDPEGGVIKVASVSGALHGTATVRPRVSEAIWTDWLSYSGTETFTQWYEANYASSGIATANLLYDVAYQSNTGFVGTETLTYTVRDPGGAESTGTLTVSVVSSVTANLAPVVTNESVSVDTGAVLVIDVLANDSDPEGHALTILSASTPSNGTVAVQSGMGMTRDKLVYTASGTVGSVTINYVVSDDQGAQTTGTVTINVAASQPIGDVTAANDTAVAGLGEEVVIRVLSNDALTGNGTLAISAVTTPVHGTVAIETRAIANPLPNGPTTEQVLVYTATGTSVADDTFTYTVTDGAGHTDTATVTVDRWNPQAAAPSLSPINLSSASGAAVTAVLATTDQNGLAVTLLSYEASSHGTIAVVTVNGQKALRFTPAAGYSGTAQVIYSMETSAGGRGTGVINVAVTANSAPVAGADAASAITGQWVTIPILANDTDADNDAIQFVSVAQPQKGSVQVYYDNAGVASLTYFANQGAAGTDQFSYTIRDASGNESTGQVQVTLSILSSLYLLNDTDTAGDGVSSDPTIAGRVDAPQGVTSATLEFDTNGDGVAESTRTVTFITANDSRGFQYVPTGLQVGSNTVAVRAMFTDPVSGVVNASSWKSVTYTFQEPAAPAVATFVKSAAGTTAAPVPKARVEGTLAGNAPFVKVEFDHNGDGVIDGTATTDKDGKFLYDPTGLPAGQVTLRVRSSVDSYVSETPIVSAWSSLTITVTLATSPGVDQLSLTRDAGTVTAPSWSSEWPEIQGRVNFGALGGAVFGAGLANPTSTATATGGSSLAGVLVEIDKDGDGIADQTVRTDADGKFTRYLTGMSVGTHTVRVRAVVTDAEQGTASPSTWSSITFAVLPRVSVTPVITDVQLITVNAHGQKIAPTIVGNADGPLSGGAYVDFQVDGTGDTPDITLMTSANGAFSYAPPNLSTGTHTVRVRVRSYDSTTRSNVSSGWVTTEVTKAAPANPVILIGGSQTTTQTTTTTGTTGTATPASAAQAVSGAVQNAVVSAASSQQSSLASTISGLASQYGMSASDFDWQSPDIQIDIPSDPFPAPPATDPSQLGGANLPGLDLASDPAFLSAAEAADSAYESALEAAANAFKATVQPVLDNYRSVTAQAAADQQTEMNRIRFQQIVDTALAKLTAAAMRLAGQSGGTATAAPDIASLETQLGADIAAIDQQLYVDIMALQDTLRDEVADVNEDFQQRMATVGPAVTADPSIDPVGFAAQMLAYYQAVEQLNIQWVDAIQAKEAKFTKDSAGKTEQAAKDKAAKTEKFKKTKADLLADYAISNALRATAGDRRNAAADNYLASRLAAIDAQAAIDSAQASATYTTATAGVRAALSATVNSAKATYAAAAASANLTRVTDRLNAASAAVTAWTSANPGPRATYEQSVFDAYKGKMLADAAAASNRASLEATQSSSAIGSIIAAESGAEIQAANDGASMTSASQSAALGALNTILAAQLQAANDTADAADTANRKIINARREYLKDEASSEKTAADKSAGYNKRLAIDLKTAWDAHRNSTQLSSIHQTTISAGPDDEPAYQADVQQANKAAARSHAGNAFTREADRIKHASTWANKRTSARVNYGTAVAAANMAAATAASTAEAGYSTTVVSTWSGIATGEATTATGVANTYRSASTTYSTALTTADYGEQIAGAGRQAGLTTALAGAASAFASAIDAQYQSTMSGWVAGLGAAAADYAAYLSSSMAATSAESSAVLGAISSYISAEVTAGQNASTDSANLGQGLSLGLINAEDGAEASVISAQGSAASGSIGATVGYETSITGAVSSFESSMIGAEDSAATAMNGAQGTFQNKVDAAYYKAALANAATKLLLDLEVIDANTASQMNEATRAEQDRAWADAEAEYYTAQANATHDLQETSINASTGLVNSAIGAGTSQANTEVGNQESLANASEGATHTVTTAFINADYGWTSGIIGIEQGLDAADMGAESGFRSTVASAGDTAETALRTAGSTFINNTAQSQLTRLTTIVNGMVGAATPTILLAGGNTSTTTMTLTQQQADFVIAQATADKTYISAAVGAGDAFASSMQGARSGLRSAIWGASDSVRSAEVGASAAYANSVASYIQTVNNTIEGAVYAFNGAQITAGANWQRDNNTARGNAMQALVTAEGNAMKLMNNATRDHANAIADAYKTELGGSTGNSTDTLYTTLLGGGNVDQTTIDGLANGNNGNTQTTNTTTGNPSDLQASFDAADDDLDQANADAENQRVADAQSAIDTLGADLQTADATWGNDMTTAGAALGAALDGIVDFDWSNVTTYITTVTNARRSAETSVLTAQLGFVTSYYGALGGYTTSMATAGVSHATAYAQATANYYVSSAAAAAAANPGDATLAARAAAFAAFASSYVSNITTAAQSAADASTTAQANANATALATLTAEVTTATAEINTFYDGIVAANATAPAKPTTDANGNPLPTATQSIIGQINAANTENANTRAMIQSALSPLTTARTTSTTNTYAALTDTNNNNTTDNTTNTNQQQYAPPANQQSPPANPPSGGASGGLTRNRHLQAQLFNELDISDGVETTYGLHRAGIGMLAPIANAAEGVDGAARGLKTGSKAVVNGAATAIVNTVTLGLNESEIAILGVTDEDRAGGYGIALGFATAGGEILIGVGTAAMQAALACGGRASRLANGALTVFDAAGNAVGVIKGGAQVLNDGLSLESGAKLAGSALGLAGNYRAAYNALLEGCFIAGTSVHLSSVPSPRHALQVANAGNAHTHYIGRAAEKPYAPIVLPIELVPLGARVDTRNPCSSDYDSSFSDPTESWKLVRMRFTSRSGARVDIEMLRPVEWIEEKGLTCGKVLFMSNSEIEVRGTGRVIAIEQCPPIADGRGSVVITRVKTHRAGNLFVVTFENGETLTGTGKHPVWSVEGQAWVALSDLKPRDHVQSREGILQVIEVIRLNDELPVYNLEVHGEHVYEVTSAGVLVHNNDCSDLAKVLSSHPDLPVRKSPSDPTHGKFNDRTPLRSGADGGQAHEVFKSQIGRLSDNAKIALSHVEGHAVAEMIKGGMTEAVVHINYKTGPCRFCKEGVPELLGDGQKLWVVFPDGVGYFTNKGWFRI